MTRDLLDRAPCWFVSFGDDGRIEYANTTLLNRLGYRRDETKARHIETLLTVGSRIFYQTHFFPLVKLHGSAEEVFIFLQAKNGETVSALCNAQRDEDAKRTDCVFMEVKERRKFEEALLEARKTAENAGALAAEANRAKTSFLAVMSHELRTPLNAIGGYVQLLEMGVHGPVTDAQLGALGRINRSQKHLLRLINDVLNLSRIEAGRVEYNIERIVVSDVIAGVLPMVEPQMSHKKLHFTSSVSPDLIVRADIEKVQQILLNLLTNATKFTAANGSIAIESGRDARSMVFIRVRDTGTGIPEDMLERIFEPFTQVKSAHSRAVEGTGLGLAISRDLARGMGGDLSARSRMGEGSVFELTLPTG